MTNRTELIEAAYERYHTEPLFHARVHLTVQAIMAESKDSGIEIPEMYSGFLTATAALALMMPDIHDPNTGEFNGLDAEPRRIEEDRQRDPGPFSTHKDQLNGLGSIGDHQHQASSSTDAPGDADQDRKD